MDSIDKIIPGLFLSNYNAAANIDIITKLGIKKIISLGSYEEHTKYTVHEGIEYLFIFIDDHENEPIICHFKECNDFIEPNTLVHCYAGISRSATIVIAYLKSIGMDYYEAHRIVKEKRPCINPNDGFLKQLEEWRVSQKM